MSIPDRKTKDPARDECAQVLERTKELGLLIGRGGFYGNVLRIKPPICIARADVDFMLDVLDIVFAELETLLHPACRARTLTMVPGLWTC